MKIKEEPVDVDYESIVSDPPNVVCILRSPADVDNIKLDSSAIGNENEQSVIITENTLNSELQSNESLVIHQPMHLPPAQLPIVGSDVHQRSSSLPACENWPGAFGFNVSFSDQQKSTKQVAWIFSKRLEKLYVAKGVPCPFNISVNTVLPNDVYIRVMALYTSPEQVAEIVHRCVNHSMEEIRNGLFEAQHLIRCETSIARYDIDSVTGRHSVIVPFENPPAGQQYSTYIYKFTCLGSCSGGPNRRPLMLIFTLERENQVIGRKKLDVKICACPGRDKKTDEARYLETDRSNLRPAVSTKRKLNSECVSLSQVMEFTKNILLPPLKKEKISPNKDGLYALFTEDKKCFEFLRQMKNFYEFCQNGKESNVKSKKTD